MVRQPPRITPLLIRIGVRLPLIGGFVRHGRGETRAGAACLRRLGRHAFAAHTFEGKGRDPVPHPSGRQETFRLNQHQREKLVSAMDDLAIRTWDLIVEGDARGLRVREDTITDLNLLALDTAGLGLFVHRFTQQAEYTSGADWEWWIGAAGHWLCLRMQAKRVDVDTYRQLDHPGHGSDDYQYDVLINGCREPWLHPLYVFYNGWADGWPADAAWNACPAGTRDASQCLHGPVARYGCAIARAKEVATLHRRGGAVRRRAASHLSHSLPWSDLFGRVTPGTPSSLEWLLDLASWLGRSESMISPRDASPRRRRGDLLAAASNRLAPSLPSYANFVRGRGHALRATSDLRRSAAQAGMQVPADWQDAYARSQFPDAEEPPSPTAKVVVMDLG